MAGHFTAEKLICAPPGAKPSHGDTDYKLPPKYTRLHNNSDM